MPNAKKVGADVQLADDGGRDYINKRRFEEEGRDLVFQEFKHPNYLQTRGGFVANLSVVGFLFCTGAKQW